MLQPRCPLLRGRACVVHGLLRSTRQRVAACAATCARRRITGGGDDRRGLDASPSNSPSSDGAASSTAELRTTTAMSAGVEMTTTRHAGGKRVCITVRGPPHSPTTTSSAQPSSEHGAQVVLQTSPVSLPSSNAPPIDTAQCSTPHHPAATPRPAPRRTRVHFTEPIKRIILIRNGMSEANDNPTTYVTTPDWRIPLLDAGKRECVTAGARLANLIGDEPVYFYYSPYVRSRQSLRYVLQGYDEGLRQASTQTARQWWDNENGAHGPRRDVAENRAAQRHVNQLNDAALMLRPATQSRIIGVREDVRLRDGDIGRYDSVADFMYHMEERDKYGNFFYRFPHGESGADVCDRVTSFLDAFQRERLGLPMDTNVVLITHGLTIRMFITRWFHLTVDTFHTMCSPPTGFLTTLTRLHHQSRFQLDDDCFAAMRLPPSLNEKNGYKYRNKELLGSMSTGAPYM